MRTTMDLPDDLMRRAKAHAALQGMKLKDLVAQLIEQGLPVKEQPKPQKYGHDRPIPVVIPASKYKPVFSTNAELNEILDREDAERYW